MRLIGGFALAALAATLAPAINISAQTSADTSADKEHEEQAELAKKLQNPVANLIRMPFQNNWDFGIGPKNAMRYTLNFQPVIPFSLNDDWNLITRTILPYIYEQAPANGLGDKGGLGDTLQSFFLSPKEPVGGWILGAGPAIQWPTSTDNRLGTGKLGAGPTAVALRQEHGFTYGALANHVWSFAGERDTPNVNNTFLQPFLAYTTKTYTTFTVNTESSYDWNHYQWTVPLNFEVQQLLKIGGHPVAFQFGYRYYADKPDNGPGWGLRFAVTLLFPKK